MIGSLHLMKRPSRPREFTDAPPFPASYESSFVTGAIYAVDGGCTAW